MIKILSFLGMGLILLSACQSLPQPLAMAVINSWQEALNKGDIERALSYVAEDASVTISPAGPEGDAVFHGHAEIRGWYDTLVGAKGITTLSNCRITGARVTCLDSYTDDGLKAMGIAALKGEWAGAIRGGKIQSYTFTTSQESLAELTAAMAAATQR